MNKLILSVDAGKYQVKAIGKLNDEDVKRVDFLNKCHTTNDIDEDCEGNSYKVQYKNEIFILGSAGANFDYDSNKTKVQNQIAIYATICKFLKANTKDNHVCMVLACPLDFINDIEMKNEYKKLIKGDSEINIVVNGENYSFIIDDITLKAEGSGVIYNNIKTFEGKDVAVIDLGGVNFSFCVYQDCVAVKESRFARNYGGNNYLLNTLAINRLRAYTKGKNITEKIAENALIDDCLTLSNKFDEESRPVIKEIKQQYLNKIKECIKAEGHDYEVITPVITGGTAQLLINTIQNDDEIGHAIIADDPKWESVEGLFIIANNKYSD